jgi:transcription initiation factor TFIIH subunit 1
LIINTQEDLDVRFPPQIQQKIQSYHSATNEILRHFWASYEPYRAEKNHRMVEGLRKQQAKLDELVKALKNEGDMERCRKVRKENGGESNAFFL